MINDLFWRLILTTVAAATIFIWDYILTFGMEVELVWKSKWNLMKGLYILQRYLPFIDTVWRILYCKSDAFSIFLHSFFIDQRGRILTKTACRNLDYSTGGLYSLTCPILTWIGKGFILLPVISVAGIAASGSRFDFHFLFRVLLTDV